MKKDAPKGHRLWRDLRLYDEIEFDGHVADAKFGDARAHLRAGRDGRDEVLRVRHENRVSLRGFGDLDAAPNDEVVTDRHVTHGWPRLGPDEEVHADRHRSDAAP